MTDLSMEDKMSKKRRKEEGKRNKRQRIQESGGMRPRSGQNNKETTSRTKWGETKKQAREDRENTRIISSDPRPEERAEERQKTTDHDDVTATVTAAPRKPVSSSSSSPLESRPHKPSLSGNSNQNRQYSGSNSSSKPAFLSKHRFGRVMERVPCRNKPRYSTVSIALPGSVLANCQTRELRTLLVGQIARAATIYHVDEIIVFDDKLGSNSSKNGSQEEQGGNHRSGGWRDFNKRQKPTNQHESDKAEQVKKSNNDKEEHQQTGGDESQRRPRSDPSEFMCRLLQYCECPQYLRRNFFPMHPDLQFAGLLAPVDAPHHVRAEDHSKYREGIVLNKVSPSGLSLVNCGIRSRPVE
jgi:predicted SPOUT superfamily RNA methylase MTH1